MKNLGNTLNPLNHLGSAFGGGFRAFGKAVTPSPPAQERTTVTPASVLAVPKSVAGETLQFEAPIAKFVDMHDAGDVTVREIPELLQDYQRLALVLKGLSHG